MNDYLFHLLWTAIWQSTLLAVVVLSVVSLLGHRLQPRFRYLLWCLVLLRLAVPVLPETPWALLKSDYASVSEPVPVVETNSPTEFLADHAENIAIDVPQSDFFVPYEPAISDEYVAAPETPSTVFVPKIPWKTVILGLWLLGVVVLGIRHVFDELRLHRQSRYWKPVTEAAFLELFQQCCREAGVLRRVDFLSVPQDIGAASMGFRRPAVLVSQAVLASMPTDQLRMVLLHELVHVRRFDPAVLRLASVLSVIYWPNPAVWFVLSRLQRDRELACDAAVLHVLDTNKEQASVTGSPIQKRYGEAILTFAQRFSASQRLPGLVGASQDYGNGRKHVIARRIDMILKYKRNKISHAVLGVFLVVLLAAFGLTRAGEKPKTDEKSETPVVETKTPEAFTVVDGSKNPVAGVSVTVMWGEDDGSTTAVTDEDGKYALNMPERFRSRWGTVFAVDKDRKRVGNGDVQIDPVTKSVIIDPITLVSARTITGTVVDAAGKPAPDVLVAGGHQTTQSEIVRTNEKGEFKFLYPEEPSLQYVYAYLEDTALDFVPTEEYPSYYGKTPQELIKDGPFQLKLRPVEPFQIRVVDEVGEPIVGSRVMPWIITNPDKPKTLRSLNDQRNRLNTSGMPVFDVKTDAEGLALVRSVPGDFLQHSTFSAYGPHDMTMPDGTKRSYGSISKTGKVLMEDGKTPTFVLPRLAVTRGSVKLEDGTPVANAHLSLRYHEGSCGSRDTDQNGEFVLMGNPNTLYNISIGSDKGAAPAIFNYSMGDGTEEKRLDIVLKKGIRVFGSVYDPDGSPSKHLDLTIDEYDPNPPESFRTTSPEKRERSQFVYGTETADRSVYVENDFKGEYECFISTEPRKYQFYARGYPSSADMRDSHDLEIKGDEKEIRLDFHLKKPGTGSIQDAYDTLKRASKWITGGMNNQSTKREPVNEKPVVETKTEKQTDPPAGKLDPKMVRFKGKATLPDGSPADGFQLLISGRSKKGSGGGTSNTHVKSDGSFTGSTFPNADYMITIFDPKGRFAAPSRYFTLKEEDEYPEEIVFKLEEGTRVIGKVVDEKTNKPVPNIELSVSFYSKNAEAVHTFFKITTDENGEYGFAATPTERVYVNVGSLPKYHGLLDFGPKERRELTRKLLRKVVFYGPEIVNLDFRIPSPFVGKVLRSDGSPAAKAHVQVQNYRPYDHATMRAGNFVDTDENGLFRLEERPRNVLCTIWVHNREIFTGWFDDELLNENEKVFQLQPSCRIEGRLIDSVTKKPLKDQLLFHERSNPKKPEQLDFMPLGTTKTDGNGHFTCSYFVGPGVHYELFVVPGKQRWYGGMPTEGRVTLTSVIPEKPGETISVGDLEVDMTKVVVPKAAEKPDAWREELFKKLADEVRDGKKKLMLKIFVKAPAQATIDYMLKHQNEEPLASFALYIVPYEKLSESGRKQWDSGGWSEEPLTMAVDPITASKPSGGMTLSQLRGDSDSTWNLPENDPSRGGDWKKSSGMVNPEILKRFLRSMLSGVTVPVEKLLQFKPLREGVDYDKPTPDEVKHCTATSLKDEGGFIVADSQGKTLRKFLDTTGDGRIDQWSYFKDGVEVWRDRDTDGDGLIDLSDKP